jgi:hypothetical protein
MVASFFYKVFDNAILSVRGHKIWRKRDLAQDFRISLCTTVRDAETCSA